MNSNPELADNFAQEHMPPKHQWPDFINMNMVTNEVPFNCAVELLDKAVEEGHGEKIALYSPNASWTYNELLTKTNQIAHILKDDLGLVSGNRVLLRSANNPMLAACWLAVIKAGERYSGF